ncbi:hypothetical protein [Streptomyces sp. NPDC088752]|uniref:hypothetical protein n=1 Tax=Streptomyces sp. NPDC088752 TaxID=3154963 RepID=UPI003416A740
MTSNAYPPGQLQKIALEQHPKADRFETAGSHDTFQGLTFTTGTRKFWWAGRDGQFSVEPLASRTAAFDALHAHIHGQPETSDTEDFDDTPTVYFDTLALWYEGWLERKSEFDESPELQAKKDLVAEWRHWYDAMQRKSTNHMGTLRYQTEKCLARIMRGDRSGFTRGWEKYWDEVLDSTAKGTFL